MVRVTRSAHLMGGIAALMMSVLLAITLISSSNRRISPSEKMAIYQGELKPSFRVFRGQQLCAEGETYCEKLLRSIFSSVIC
jgi:hypothetical protein